MIVTSEYLQSAEFRNSAAASFEKAIGKFVKGTLVNEERHLYYALARDYYMGYGSFVELGSFLGASSRAFAAGLRDNPRARVGRLQCFDLFYYDNSWGQGGIDSYLTEKEKMDFLACFRENISGLEQYIDINQGNILDCTGDSFNEIELLFVDLAKTPELMLHIGQYFLSRLPEGALYIQQDYLFDGLPFIKAFHEFFWEYFEMIEPNAGSTVVFRMRKKFSPTSEHLNACAKAMSGDDMKQLVVDNGTRFSDRYQPFFKYA